MAGPAHGVRSPRSFSPYKDSLEETGSLLSKSPSETVRDLEDVQLYSPKRKPTWGEYIMSLRPRFAKDTSVESHSDFPRRTEKAPGRKRKWLGRMCIGIPVVVLMFLGLLHVCEVLLGWGSAIFEYEVDDFLPEYGYPGHLGDGLAEYPTDFTRGVQPVPVHSHNDYWRRVPLYQALHYGCVGVEADVWLYDSELFVGHNTASLTKTRTFRNLYVDPLVEILDRQNPTNSFSNTTGHGVFDEDPAQTVVLLVDFKTDGAELYPHVYAQLDALRAKNYLTFWDGQTRHDRAVTVVATGNAPFDQVIANTTYRDIFFDAPLADLSDPQPPTKKRGQGHNGVADDAVFDASNSFYASVSLSSAIGIMWAGQISEQQLDVIRRQIQGAHDRGLMVRYWDTPTWPVGYRNHVWDVLVQEGVDFLNADDLRSAAERDWTKGTAG